MDQLYTSFEVANWIAEKKITILGTIQTSRMRIPFEIQELSNRELLSNEVYWEENGKTILGSYVVKTSKGKKTFLCYLPWNQY